MDNILTLNQSIFGTKTKERRNSRRALKASVQELYVPQESDVITYDEGFDIDGAWKWNWGAALTCVAGAATVVAGVFALPAVAATVACAGTVVGVSTIVAGASGIGAGICWFAGV